MNGVKQMVDYCVGWKHHVMVVIDGWNWMEMRKSSMDGDLDYVKMIPNLHCKCLQASQKLMEMMKILLGFLLLYYLKDPLIFLAFLTLLHLNVALH